MCQGFPQVLHEILPCQRRDPKRIIDEASPIQDLLRIKLRSCRNTDSWKFREHASKIRKRGSGSVEFVCIESS